MALRKKVAESGVDYSTLKEIYQGCIKAEEAQKEEEGEGDSAERTEEKEAKEKLQQKVGYDE